MARTSGTTADPSSETTEEGPVVLHNSKLNRLYTAQTADHAAVLEKSGWKKASKKQIEDAANGGGDETPA